VKGQAATLEARKSKGTEMETFTQPKITGYRQLDEIEATLMNEIKAHGEATKTLLTRVQVHLTAQISSGDAEIEARHKLTEPQRWLSIGRTHTQEGLMALTRAVAQPTSF
jgi:hypothetical protein